MFILYQNKVYIYILLPSNIYTMYIRKVTSGELLQDNKWEKVIVYKNTYILKRVDLYIRSPIRLHGVVLN
jgi:hypothetical protein